MNYKEMTFENLSHEEQLCYNRYKKNSYDINDSLRKGIELNFFQCKVFDNLISKYENNAELILYRVTPYTGITESIYKDLGYMSCCKDISELPNFCTEVMHYIFKISIPVGKHLIDMTKNEEFAGESEILLPRDSQFNITNTIIIDNYKDILLFFDDDRYMVENVKQLTIISMTMI